MGKGCGVGLLAVLAVMSWAAWASGQGPAGPASDPYGSPPAGHPAEPGPATPAGPQTVPPQQPPLPSEPTLQRRGPPSVAAPGLGADQADPASQGARRYPAALSAPRAPFVLSPEQVFQLDQVLAAWERRNQEVKSFECSFTRFDYDYVFTQGDQPRKVRDQGILKYAAPDKGLYKIEGERSAEWKETSPGTNACSWQKFAGDRSEQWICDGKSIFEYRFQVPPNTPKRRIEHPLPPELQGKAISDGPLPFVFGTEAQKLKERYWLRINTPPDVRGEIWIEAYPRLQKDAANFYKLDVILKTNGLLPDAIQIIEPNRKDRKVYKFEDVVINRRLRFLESDWFRAPLPLGWRAEVDPPQGPAQAGYPRQAGGTPPRR
jgi:TIGR03009 family protein